MNVKVVIPTNVTTMHCVPMPTAFLSSCLRVYLGDGQWPQNLFSHFNVLFILKPFSVSLIFEWDWTFKKVINDDWFWGDLLQILMSAQALKQTNVIQVRRAQTLKALIPVAVLKGTVGMVETVQVKAQTQYWFYIDSSTVFNSNKNNNLKRFYWQM